MIASSANVIMSAPETAVTKMSAAGVLTEAKIRSISLMKTEAQSETKKLKIHDHIF